jgi:hypothetical protein
MMSERIWQIRIALALVIGGALAGKALGLLYVTPAALIASILIAVTLAAGQRKGAAAKLAMMWWMWCAVCLADSLVLHLLQASGMQCFLAFLLSGFFIKKTHRQLTGKTQPRQQSKALVPAPNDGAVAVIDREAA